LRCCSNSAWSCFSSPSWAPVHERWGCRRFRSILWAASHSAKVASLKSLPPVSSSTPAPPSAWSYSCSRWVWNSRSASLPPACAHVPSGFVDLLLNAAPGALARWLIGFGMVGVLALAGATYVSSSGMIARLLNELGRLGNQETPAILSVLVSEDGRCRGRIGAGKRSASAVGPG